MLSCYDDGNGNRIYVDLEAWALEVIAEHGLGDLGDMPTDVLAFVLLGDRMIVPDDISGIE